MMSTAVVIPTMTSTCIPDTRRRLGCFVTSWRSSVSSTSSLHCQNMR